MNNREYVTYLIMSSDFVANNLSYMTSLTIEVLYGVDDLLYWVHSRKYSYPGYYLHLTPTHFVQNDRFSVGSK